MRSMLRSQYEVAWASAAAGAQSARRATSGVGLMVFMGSPPAYRPKRTSNSTSLWWSLLESAQTTLKRYTVPPRPLEESRLA